MSARKPPTSFKGYERHGSNDAGWGSFGYVYFYRLATDPKMLYAVKAIPDDKIRLEEVETLSACKHDNIVRYIDHHYQDSLYFIVTELLNSSLYDALRGAKKSLFVLQQTSRGVRITQGPFLPKPNECECFQIVEDCFQGLIYLHSLPIIHRDIYPPNILLEVTTKQNVRVITAKLCDFGLSKQGCDGHQTALQNIYSAPETNSTNNACYSLNADVFSFGVVIAEIFFDLSGVKKDLFNSKFIDKNRAEWSNTLWYGTKYSKKPVKYASAVNFVSRMTEKDPKKRYSVTEAYLLWREFYGQITSGNEQTIDPDEDDDLGEENVPVELVEPESSVMEVEQQEVKESEVEVEKQFQDAFERAKCLKPSLTVEEFFKFIHS